MNVGSCSATFWLLMMQTTMLLALGSVQFQEANKGNSRLCPERAAKGGRKYPAIDVVLLVGATTPTTASQQRKLFEAISCDFAAKFQFAADFEVPHGVRFAAFSAAGPPSAPPLFDFDEVKDAVELKRRIRALNIRRDEIDLCRLLSRLRREDGGANSGRFRPEAERLFVTVVGIGKTNKRDAAACDVFAHWGRLNLPSRPFWTLKLVQIADADADVKRYFNSYTVVVASVDELFERKHSLNVLNSFLRARNLVESTWWSAEVNEKTVSKLQSNSEPEDETNQPDMETRTTPPLMTRKTSSESDSDVLYLSIAFGFSVVLLLVAFFIVVAICWTIRSNFQMRQTRGRPTKAAKAEAAAIREVKDVQSRQEMPAPRAELSMRKSDSTQVTEDTKDGDSSVTTSTDSSRRSEHTMNGMFTPPLKDNQHTPSPYRTVSSAAAERKREASSPSSAETSTSLRRSNSHSDNSETVQSLEISDYQTKSSTRDE